MTTALMSGIVAIAGVLLSSYSTIRTIRMQHELNLRRSELDKHAVTEEVMSRYPDPLLRSTIDLQGRIYSIVTTGYVERHINSNDPELSGMQRRARYIGSPSTSAGWRFHAEESSSSISAIRLEAEN